MPGHTVVGAQPQGFQFGHMCPHWWGHCAPAQFLVFLRGTMCPHYWGTCPVCADMRHYVPACTPVHACARVLTA